jgi:hypothetical protein
VLRSHDKVKRFTFRLADYDAGAGLIHTIICAQEEIYRELGRRGKGDGYSTAWGRWAWHPILTAASKNPR